MAIDFSGSVPDRIGPNAPVLNLPPSPFYYLMAHPNRWDVIGGRVRPDLGRLSVSPGIAGVTQAGDMSLAIADAEGRRGWTVLRRLDPAKYIRVYKGRRGAVHLPAWRTPKQIGRRVVLKDDKQAMYQFLDSLVSDGLIPPCDPDLAEGLIDIAASRVTRSAGSPARLKVAQARLDEIKSAVAALIAETDADG